MHWPTSRVQITHPPISQNGEMCLQFIQKNTLERCPFNSLDTSIRKISISTRFAISEATANNTMPSRLWFATHSARCLPSINSNLSPYGTTAVKACLPGTLARDVHSSIFMLYNKRPFSRFSDSKYQRRNFLEGTFRTLHSGFFVESQQSVSSTKKTNLMLSAESLGSSQPTKYSVQLNQISPSETNGNHEHRPTTESITDYCYSKHSNVCWKSCPIHQTPRRTYQDSRRRNL